MSISLEKKTIFFKSFSIMLLFHGDFFYEICKFMLQIYAHSIQEGKNECFGYKNKCSHLCFALPGKNFKCGCPDNMIEQNNECLCEGKIKPFANNTCPKGN